MAAGRTVLLLAHTGRAQAVEVARQVAKGLLAAGLGVRVLAAEAAELAIADAEVASEPAAEGCEIALVIGGDGTILRAANETRLVGTPLLGVNLGHVGFLAEVEMDDVDVVVGQVVRREYTVEERLTIDISVTVDGSAVVRMWALNEASVEKAARERMLEVVVEIDGRPLSRWGCDGVVCATPTGSTAYAFSAGGPVVWPEVEALLMVPISAHALFARPMIVSPDSVLAVEVLADTQGSAVLWCDGRRSIDVPPGARIEVRRGSHPIRLARLHQAPFTDRLVAKFDLPVAGWRGNAEKRANRNVRSLDA